MAALAWLLIPLAAAVAVTIWGRWAAHHHSTADGASLAGYERFRQAMQNTTPPPGVAKDAARTAGEAVAPAATTGAQGTKEPEASKKSTGAHGGGAKGAEAKGAKGAKGSVEPRRPRIARAIRRARSGRIAPSGAAVAGAVGGPAADGGEDSPRGPVAGPVP